MKETNNVILFPKTIENLEKDGFAALDAEDFETALEKLDLLTQNQVYYFELNISKIMCLVKLDKYTEAEEFCEELLKNKSDEHYYDYFMQYILLLFERNRYNEIRYAIGDALKVKSIPKRYMTAFKELYFVSHESNETTANQLLNEFKLAVNENNHQKQWEIINNWKQLRVEPPETFITLLTLEKIHPLVKTNLIGALKTSEINNEIEIVKFGERLIIRPSELPEMDEHPLYQMLLEKLQNVEQENPTLFQIVEELLQQFIYVRYPFFFPIEDADIVANAFVHLGKQHLLLESSIDDEKMNEYVKIIQVCSEIYIRITQQ